MYRLVFYRVECGGTAVAYPHLTGLGFGRTLRCQHCRAFTVNVSIALSF